MTDIGTPSVQTFTGTSFIAAMKSAQAALKIHQKTINRINVFPVPDGDTGTNMLATLTSGLDHIGDVSPEHLGEALGILANGSFWGARGNSGVLLSQFIQGVYRHLITHETCTTRDMVDAIKVGHSTAFSSMSEPVEGTMLSIMESVSLSFESSSTIPSGLTPFWQQIVASSRDYVDDTPNQMPLLAQSGVVDSGALGLLTIFVGIWAHYADLQLENIPIYQDIILQTSIQTSTTTHPIASDDWGFCTQFVVTNGGNSAKDLRTSLSSLGNSILTTELDNSIKLHIHTKQPQLVIDTALGSGTLNTLMIENMDDHETTTTPLSYETDPDKTCCLISITDDGFGHIFTESGLASNIATEQNDPTFFTSLIQIIEQISPSDIILMATSLNQLKTIQHLEEASICGSTVKTMVFHTPVHAICAALTFNPYNDSSVNFAKMSSQASQTLCISINPLPNDQLPVYPSQSIDSSQYISTIEYQEIAIHTDIAELISASLPDLCTYTHPILTIYRGSQTSESEAIELVDKLEQILPDTTIDMLFANQSSSLYLISLE